MPTSDQNNPDDALREKLEELESLLEKDESDATPSKIKVPVLDELVTEADFINSENADDIELIDEQITDLAGKLEQKFSGELDQLVRLLKDNLKNSIVEELRTQANIAEDNLDLDDSFNKKITGDIDNDDRQES
ncbi:MAG: hypothetical protein HN764_17255 [Gammaproteobacteria bacterium]|jgi:hypothetical protein|nr:hypothetical protein [Gammaproteobacteria bacterium]